MNDKNPAYGRHPISRPMRINHVKQPFSVRSRVCRRKAILALLDQLTSFGQRESLTIHASSGSGRMSAVSSAQSVEMLQSVATRWRCSKWFGNQKFQGGHPSNYLWSQTLLKGWSLTFLTRGFGFYGKPVIGFGFAFSAGLFRT